LWRDRAPQQDRERSGVQFVNAPPKNPKADTDTISKFLYALFAAASCMHSRCMIEIVCIRRIGN